MGRAPVFQMSLGMDSASRIGWLLSDETEQPDDAYSFAFTVPWHPNISFDQCDFVLFGDRQGKLLEFPLKFDGHLFINEQTKTRFSLSDPLAPNDFRGLPFLRPFPYIGAFRETLESYDLTRDFLSFLPLTPLDLIRMDDLFLKEHITFVGVTHSFGPHTRSGFRWSQPAAAYLGEAIEAGKQEFKDDGSIEPGHDPPDVSEIMGKTYLGKVVRLGDFGAFVEISPGIDGLLHISEVSEHRIRDVRDELKEGDQILVKVLALEGNKIKLSRKAVLREQRKKRRHAEALTDRHP